MTKIPLRPENERFTDEQWQAIFDQEITCWYQLPLVLEKPQCLSVE